MHSKPSAAFSMLPLYNMFLGGSHFIKLTCTLLGHLVEQLSSTKAESLLQEP